MSRYTRAQVEQILVVLNNTLSTSEPRYRLCICNGGYRVEAGDTGQYIGQRGSARETYKHIDSMIKGIEIYKYQLQAEIQLTRAAQPPVRFEVLTAMGNEPENCWTEDGKPQTFATPEEAQAEIDDHLATVSQAVAEGHMSCEYDADDYTIQEVK